MGVSSCSMPFTPPPIRITSRTLAGGRLSPGRVREFAYERLGNEASTYREAGTGESPRTQTIEFVDAPHLYRKTGVRCHPVGMNYEWQRERMQLGDFIMLGLQVLV